MPSEQHSNRIVPKSADDVGLEPAEEYRWRVCPKILRRARTVLVQNARPLQIVRHSLPKSGRARSPFHRQRDAQRQLRDKSIAIRNRSKESYLETAKRHPWRVRTSRYHEQIREASAPPIVRLLRLIARLHTQ